MEDVTRKRVLRMLEALPEAQLYEVLDYIEFLEVKYAREAGRKPDPFQRFAERVEDQMRLRSVAPKAIKGTMKLMGTAGRMLDGVRGLGRDLAGKASPTGRPRGEDGREAGAGRRRGSREGPRDGTRKRTAEGPGEGLEDGVDLPHGEGGGATSSSS